MSGIAGGDRSDITFGIALTTDPTRARHQLDLFCRALEAATGFSVAAAPMWHYRRLLEAMDSGEVTHAWLPPILAMRATAKGRITPLALPVRNGVSTYCTALFCRQESPYVSASELLGVKAAWVDRQSAAGYLIIRAALRAQGVKLDDAFGADMFLGAHDAVARAVLDGDAEVGATFIHLDPPDAPRLEDAKVLRAGWGGADVRILAHAGPIPSDLVASNRSVAPELTKRVQRALVDQEHPELRASAKALLSADAFVRPAPEHLAPLAKLLEGLEDETGSDRGMSLMPGR